MRKRLGLLAIGFVLALGAFFLYQFFTNASFLSPRVPPKIPDKIISSADRSQTFEFRKKNTGELVYIVTAKSADPIKDEKGNNISGQYKVAEPGATFYTKDGRTMNFHADSCILVLDPVAKSAKAPKATNSDSSDSDINAPQIRLATLSGHVLLTISPKPNAVGPHKAGEGEMTVAFDGDVQFFQSQNLLTSPGSVHIRSQDVSYDGEGLNLSFNRDEQRIEYLRIDKGDTVILRNVGKDALKLDNDETAAKTPGSSTAATAPAGPPAPPAPPASPPVKVAATGPAATQTATTKKKPSLEDTTYKLAFGNDVKASLGTNSLESASLYVLFTPSRPAPDKKDTAAGEAATTATAGASTQPAMAASRPAANSGRNVAAVPSSRPAADDYAARHALAIAPYAPAGPDDLVIHWKGPMEMRPSGPDDLRLTGPQDRALEAVGTREMPVKLRMESRTLTSGRLWLHTAAQRVEIEPGDLPNVQLVDAAQGNIACQGISIVRGRLSQTVTLKGPGTAEIPQAAMKKEGAVAKAPGGGRGGARPDADARSWTTRADLDFVTADDPKKPNKKTSVLRHATFTGDVVIKDPTYQMLADSLDFTIAQTSDPKTPQALEHMLGAGNVRIKFARPGFGIDDASKPEGLTADNLEVFTDTHGTKVPSPSRILATGNVVAWTYSKDEGETSAKAAAAAGPAMVPGVPVVAAVALNEPGKRLVHETIYTPRLDMLLEPKEKTDKAAVADKGAAGAGLVMGSSSAMKSMTASQGVKIEIDGIESASGRSIVANAQTLTADKFGKAVLDGAIGIDATNGVSKRVQIVQGENLIEGDHVLLDQKLHTIEVPGEGVFSFAQPPKKGEAEGTIRITWTKRMTFDEKSGLARFTGNIETRLLNKADQTSEMTCKELLEVTLFASKGARPAGNNDAAGRLKSILARGDVLAKGVTYEPGTQKVLTSMDLRTAELRYDAESEVLNIPCPGTLIIEDYRVEKTAKAPDGRSRPDAPDSKGITGFIWKEKLSYTGQKNGAEAGTIRMSGDVFMHHVPVKPFATTAPAVVNKDKEKESKELRLWGQTIVAHLTQAKEAGGGKAASNPTALGAGGDMKFSDALAAGKARLEMGDDAVVGDSLSYDDAKRTAIVHGKRGALAQVVRPGQAIMSTDEDITWDLATNNFKIPHSTGTFTVR